MPKPTDKHGKLTSELLRTLIDYDDSSGQFTWKARSGCSRADKIFNSKHAGKIAGCADRRGYCYIRIRQFGMFSAHRLAWLHVSGSWPKDEIDHEDGNPSNNAFVNLREATRSQNAANRGIHKNNKSGTKGVSYNSRKGLWVAQAAMNGKVIKLYSNTKEGAEREYNKLAVSLQGEFARVA